MQSIHIIKRYNAKKTIILTKIDKVKLSVSNIIEIISIFIHQHIDRACIYKIHTLKKKHKVKWKNYNNSISVQCVTK